MRSGVAVGLVAMLLVSGCTASGSRQTPAPGRSLPTRPPPAAVQPPDGRSEPVADPLYPDYGNPAIDVLRYDLTLDWQPGTRLLTGTAVLTIRVAQPVSEIRLDLSSALAVRAALLDGGAVAVTRAGHRVVLPAGRALVVGSTVEARIEYFGSPREVPFPGARQDVDASGTEIAANGAIWSMQEPYGGFTWYPCSDHPSDKALYSVSITAPSGWSGVTSGRFLGTSSGPAGTTTRWQATEPVASYLVAFAIGQYQRVDLAGPRGLPITLWLTTADEQAMLPVLRLTPALLGWLEGHLGPYPFASAGAVVVPDRSALETQTMVTMSVLPGRSGEVVLLHELAHQWFGDAVGPRTWRDLWLNEGFATYVEFLYRTERLNADPRELLQRYWAGEKVSRRVAGPAGKADPRYFADHNSYFGPALMLHEIRRQVGDGVFFAMLHDWVQHHRFSTQDRASFTAWLNTYTDRDLTPILDKWLDSPSVPAFPE